ncbi:hypothetical protein [uncultured Hoeflea sp.]|uniref:hypothetical protein n=1 Tax=uncultured Hoeflea sp. TaxID=538666 RepID=UPI002631DB40|nr:hypothetical protein [uncultured Hoeflea sp.]
MNDAEEGGPVQESRIDFSFESGVIVHADGARETVYCIRNDESAPIYVKWHGPKPDLLFEDYATGRGYKAEKGQKSYTSTNTDDRTIEYGLTRNYGQETESDTITFAGTAMSAQIVPVQLTPMDTVGLSMSDVLADADFLDEYLNTYREAPNGGSELVIWTYSRNWLPADVEALARLAAGEGIEDYEGPYIPISYGLRSAIDIDNRVATSSARFWFGHFAVNAEGFALALDSGIRNRLSVITASMPFAGLAELNADASFPLSEAEPFLNQGILEAKVGGGATAQIVPWTIGLAFDGVSFSAMHAELFAN